MPALTPAQQYARDLAEGSETARQPVANLVATSRRSTWATATR
jgi:hypothetical protein